MPEHLDKPKETSLQLMVD